METSSINSYEKTAESLDSSPVSKIQVCGDSDEYMIIGGKKYHRHELYSAFGGTFQTERYAPAPKHEFGNASSYALAGFGITTLILAMMLTGGGGLKTTNVVMGCTMFVGGVGLFFGGMWEFFIGNTFAYTTFTSFGAFWMAFGAINIPAFGIAAAYGEDTVQLHNAIGFWLLGWVIFTTMLFTFTWKATLAFIITFFVLDVTFILLAVFYMTGITLIERIASGFGIVTALMGFYNMYAGIATPQNTYIMIPVVPMPDYSKK